MSEILSDEEYDKLLRAAVDEKVKAVMPRTDSVGRPVGMDPRPAPMMRPSEDMAGETETGATKAPQVEASPQPADAFQPLMMPGLGRMDTATATQAAKTVGGIAGGELAAAAVPAIGAGTALGRIATSGVRGAAGGAGSVVGSGNLNPRDIGKGALIGGAVGTATGAVGEGIGAAKKAYSGQLMRAGGAGMKSADYEKFFTSREGVVNVLKSEPDVRKALGDPEKMIPLIEQKLPAAHADALRVLDTADAQAGRIPLAKSGSAFSDAWAELQRVGGSEGNPAANVAERFGKQFTSGIGGNPSKPPSSAQIREFMTEVIGPSINPRPVTVDDKATNKAAGVLYAKLATLLKDHAEEAGPGLAAKLDELNNRQATYIMLKDAAKRGQMLDSKATGGAGAWLKDKLVKTAAGAAVGGTVGAYAGGDRESAETGSVLGAATALGGSAVGRAAVRAAASPAVQAIGQNLAPAGAHAAHVLIPRIISAVQSGDHRAAQKVAADAVYGGEAP